MTEPTSAATVTVDRHDLNAAWGVLVAYAYIGGGLMSRVQRSDGGTVADPTENAAARAIPRRLLQLLGRELDYRDARHLRRHFCFSCDKRTVLEHVHTDAFVRRSRA